MLTRLPNKHLLIKFFLLFLFFFESIVFAKDKVVLNGKGSGKTSSESYKAAVNDLTSQVFVSFSSNIKVIEESNSGTKVDTAYLKHVLQKSHINSYGFFVDLKKVKSYKKRGVFYTEVSLSDKAIERTLKYLEESVLKHELDTITYVQAFEIRKKLEFYVALTFFYDSYTSGYYFLTNGPDLINLAEKKIQMLDDKLSLKGKLKFIVEPSNAPNLIIMLKGQASRILQNNKTVLLDDGEYNVKIIADGYKTREMNINVYEGDNIVKSIFLYNDYKRIDFNIVLEGKDVYTEPIIKDITYYLRTKYSIHPNKNAPYTLNISYTKDNTVVLAKADKSMMASYTINVAVLKRRYTSEDYVAFMKSRTVNYFYSIDQSEQIIQKSKKNVIKIPNIPTNLFIKEVKALVDDMFNEQGMARVFDIILKEKTH